MAECRQVQNLVDEVIKGLIEPSQRIRAVTHLYGVASCCVLLAYRRGLDARLGEAMGLLRDVYRYKTGVECFHAFSGADMVRVALRGITEFTEEEKRTMLSAIYHHGDKAHVHDAYDELLKDADVLQPFLNGDFELTPIRKQRLLCIAGELRLTLPVDSFKEPVRAEKIISNRHEKLAGAH